MTKKMNEVITIIGFRQVQIDSINNFLDQFKKEEIGFAVQFFDAKNVAGPQHLYFAALHALAAFENNTNISNSLSVEALLYASAQRQIKKAVQMLGIKQDSSELATLIITEKRNETDPSLKKVSETVPGERDDTVVELTEKKVENLKKVFSISDLEFEAKLTKEGLEKEALTDLIIERMALLVTRS